MSNEELYSKICNHRTSFNSDIHLYLRSGAHDNDAIEAIPQEVISVADVWKRRMEFLILTHRLPELSYILMKYVAPKGRLTRDARIYAILSNILASVYSVDSEGHFHYKDFLRGILNDYETGRTMTFSKHPDSIAIAAILLMHTTEDGLPQAIEYQLCSEFDVVDDGGKMKFHYYHPGTVEEVYRIYGLYKYWQSEVDPR
ncbi:hypothetical protein KQI63_05765 [bacterium]|nr:hypothetical protein [bacterium]